MIDFKKRIQDLCKERGIKQKELAKEMGISDVALTALLNRGDPHISTVERFAKVFGLSLMELMMESNEDSAVLKVTCPKCKTRIGLFPMIIEKKQNDDCGKEVTITLGASIGNDEKS